MRERLRKISEQPPGAGVVFFRQQTDIVAERQQALEKSACLPVAVLQRVVVSEPETAGEEYAFSWRQTIDSCAGAIAHHEAIHHQFMLDRRDGAAYSRIIRREEAYDRQQQQAGIELAAAEALCESVLTGIEPAFADRGVHEVAKFAPPLQRCLKFEPLSVAHRAIQGHPRHDFGKRELATSASHFPDALVRHLPDILQMLNQRLLLCPGRGDRSEKVISHLIGGTDQLPEDVELQLSGRGVADANRGCAMIAWQPRHVPFLQLSFARKAIHDLDLVRTAGHAALQPSPPR